MNYLIPLLLISINAQAITYKEANKNFRDKFDRELHQDDVNCFEKAKKEFDRRIEKASKAGEVYVNFMPTTRLGGNSTDMLAKYYSDLGFHIKIIWFGVDSADAAVSIGWR